jgi:hypothetical protein
MPAKFTFTFCQFLQPPPDELKLNFYAVLVGPLVKDCTDIVSFPISDWGRRGPHWNVWNVTKTELTVPLFTIGKIFSRLFRYTWDQYYQQWWRHHQNPRWPPKTKVVIFPISSKPFVCLHWVDAVQKISCQYLFRFPNWSVPKLRITCFAYWRQTRSRSVFYVTPANL